MKAIAILKDKSGKTIGALLCDNNNRTKEFTTMELASMSNKIALENAIITKDGYVRAKTGKLNHLVKNTKPNVEVQADILNAKKLLNKEVLTLYHGNKDKGIIPKYGCGKKDNDYGQGFYTTPDKELAKEWAWAKFSRGSVGYLHTYSLDITGLNVLNLTELDSMHWIAELLYHRKLNTNEFTDSAAVNRRIKQFIKLFKLDTSDYDIIIGYRADDSYFSYVSRFVLGQIFRSDIEKALRYGELGLQIFIKSKKAFNKLKKQCDPEIVPEKYRDRFDRRDKEAYLKVNRLLNMRKNTISSDNEQDIYDIISNAKA